MLSEENKTQPLLDFETSRKTKIKVFIYFMLLEDMKIKFMA
jgi:hypothetical protein